ncbi:hypothetical protein QBC33DRAFT_253416 [Phialemonium atrogriseum]|uniref:Rhodopsin domain-containing protein n=1 Tax=Phialemonium atrogriseum TaxID=1093897 RepID=A0AAJ0FJA1_9PEZI|nr:uncharacterized protein QBC33DRAFT_253416 [Phialemonium atrogriseum]KAK1762900.1 hypothetical protein QBC33DRAFT_253416 [Phialemonium atrogriseum]
MDRMPFKGEFPELDAETRVPLLVGISIGFLCVSTVAVLLRLYTRYIVVKSPGSDDATIAIAQVLAIGVSITTILQAKYGLGHHVWLVSDDDNTKQLKSFFSAIVIYNLAQIITKTSFLLQYRRIFEDKLTKQACLVLIIVLGIWGVVQEVLVGFACFPVSVFIPRQQGICIESLTVWYLTSIMNIVTDFIVFTVPMPAIAALNLQRKQKLLVASVLCLGFFTCAISIVRIFTLRSANDSPDPTWDNVPSAYWSIVELNTGILCASLPPLRPLIRHLFPGLSSSSSSSQNPNSRNRHAHSNSKAGGGGYTPRRSAGSATLVDGSEKGVEAYGLSDVESGAEEGWSGSAGREGYRVRTEIRGGRDVIRKTADDDGDGDGDDTTSSGSSSSVVGAGGRKIMVTREIGFEEGRGREVGRGRGEF